MIRHFYHEKVAKMGESNTKNSVGATHCHYYWSCSPPVAEYALAIVCQFWQPTVPWNGAASWERVDCSLHYTTRRWPYWVSKGLFYPSWNRTDLQLICSSVADCQALTWLTRLSIRSYFESLFSLHKPTFLRETAVGAKNARAGTLAHDWVISTTVFDFRWIAS